MRQKPILLFVCALLFLYFPLETAHRWIFLEEPFYYTDLFLGVIFPAILMMGLLKVTRAGWYTLVGMVTIWGIRDLQLYYAAKSQSIIPLLTHLAIYAMTIGYFINPRIRSLYFDPKMRWWRQKKRFETHLPMILNLAQEWHYPVLRNISEGGCFVETPHLIPINTPLDVMIPLPEPVSVSVIRTAAIVRWTSDNPLRSGMGLSFITSAPLQDQAIKEYVSELES